MVDKLVKLTKLQTLAQHLAGLLFLIDCREKEQKNIVSYEKRLKVIINVKKEKEKYSNYKIRIKNSLLKTINFTISYLLKYTCTI